MRRDSATSFPDEGGQARRTGSGASFSLLPFAACLAYSPAGSGTLCEAARRTCARLKAADPVWLPRLVAGVWLEASGRGRFATVFGDGVVLIPVPGSSPVEDAGWVGAHLAWCLKAVGLAAEVWPILYRRHAVRKSAFAAAGERPSVLEHYVSFAVGCAPLDRLAPGRDGLADEPYGRPLRLTLVDDVITRGRTLLAAAGRLHEAFPGAEIRAFALLRTLGREEMLRRILDPCEGEVRWISGDARRVP